MNTVATSDAKVTLVRSNFSDFSREPLTHATSASVRAQFGIPRRCCEKREPDDYAMVSLEHVSRGEDAGESLGLWLPAD